MKSRTHMKLFGVGVLVLVAALTGSACSSAPGAHGSSRWDKIVAGEWYVPSQNLEAYQVGPDSAERVFGAFQNWYVFKIRNGHYTGPTQSVVSTYEDGVWSAPVTVPAGEMTGDISPDGTISMTITSPGEPVGHATGHMIFVSGQWRMTMQTDLPEGDGVAPYVLQWANMTKLREGETIPGSPSFADLGSLVNTQPSTDPLDSPQYSWLGATDWSIRDSSFTSGQPEDFRINTYSNGYFFGSSIGANPFSVTGTVRPDGGLYLVFTRPDGTMTTRSGTVSGNGARARMVFHTYYGATPAAGSATLLHAEP
ncbi:MAG: hypothetical protein NTX58_15495 [Actinobacteria bacterium]|nr:hypothetical protein [Actinomycetota bacterium]